VRAIVTGAGSLIGAAVAHRLADDGFDVTVADPEPDAVATDLGATAVRRDLRDEVRVAQAMEGVHVLVNATAIGSSSDAPNTPLEVWDDAFALSARGTFLCCKHAINAMKELGGGAIVNVASVGALVGLEKRVAYCASHGAVVALTRALAVDHARDGIRVNAVCPGGVEELRDAQPLRRLGTPEEVADAVVYLATAEYVTGAILTVDGGFTAA
jgi:NAD(P)-dependent dehydrogenase (short-subunit alcohol dehydrogenase family)